MTSTRTRGRVPVWRCAPAVTAVVVALLGTVAPGVSGAAAASDDVQAPTAATPAGSFDGVDYVRYDGVFAGHTSTGAFRVPYRITAPVDPDDGNGAVVVEPPHFGNARTKIPWTANHTAYACGSLYPTMGSTTMRGGCSTWR